jgi:signal transduction histidine kinase
MRQSGQREQYTLLLSTIAIVVLILVVFALATNDILRGITEEETQSRRLWSDYLECKNNCVASLVVPATALPTSDAIHRELALCDEEVAELAASPLMKRMLEIGNPFPTGVGIAASWAALRPTLLRVIGVPSDPALLLDSLLRNSASFESDLKTSIDLIVLFEDKQRGAIRLLQESIAITAAALCCLGFFTVRSARREQTERERLGELLSATYSAQELERSRIALELHDSIAQDLSASIMMVRRLEENGSGDRARLVSSLKSSIDSLRAISWELRPPELRRLGLVGALAQLADEEDARGAAQDGPRITVELESCDLADLGDDAALQLYRIAQEALMNARRHSHAAQVSVGLSRSDSRLVLAIVDDGEGFDAEAAARGVVLPGHLGLAGMRERARLAGGSLFVSSRPGYGTKVIAEVPCAS